MWLVVGPSPSGSPYPDGDVAAFREEFGPDSVIRAEEVFMEARGGRLSLHDPTGVEMIPPKVAYVRMAFEADRSMNLLTHLRLMGSLLFNGDEAQMNCANKFRQLQLLTLAGLPVPDTSTYVTAEISGAVAAGIPEPCVVKSSRGACGDRVFFADREMLDDISGNLLHDNPYLFQRYHGFRRGRDLRVVVVDGLPVGALIRSNRTGGFKSNISLGGAAEPCLGRYPAGEQLACRAAAAVGADLAGVDLLFEPDGSFTICEVNASPGTTCLPQVTPAIIAACAVRVRQAALR